jgi:hypothetical protein
MDEPVLEPYQEGRQDDAKPRLPLAWPYGILILLVNPLLIAGVGYLYPAVGCGFTVVLYLAEMIGGLILRGGEHDRLGRALIFAVVATCAVVAVGLLVISGICLVGK